MYSQFNDTIEVIQNSLDFKGDRGFVGWDTVSPKKHKGVRIGWIGGRSHFADLMMVAPTLRYILQKYPEVTLSLVNSAIKPTCDALGKAYPFEGIKRVQYADRSVAINRYAAFAASFGFDIGIAPLVDCNFNRSKSNLRWLEYSALKVPTVASNVGHFKETLRPAVDGFLASDESDWRQALSHLIEDAYLRQRVGDAAYKRVKNDFNVARNAAKYVRTLKNLANFKATEEEWTSQPSKSLLAI